MGKFTFGVCDMCKYLYIHISTLNSRVNAARKVFFAFGARWSMKHSRFMSQRFNTCLFDRFLLGIKQRKQSTENRVNYRTKASFDSRAFCTR